MEFAVLREIVFVSLLSLPAVVFAQSKLSEEGKMQVSMVEGALKDCPPEKNPATAGSAEDAGTRLDKCLQRMKGARQQFDRIPQPDRSDARVVTAQKSLELLESNLPKWKKDWDEQTASAEKLAKQKSDAYWAFTSALSDHKVFVADLESITSTGAAEYAKKTNPTAKDMVKMVGKGQKFEASMAECNGAWKVVLEDKKLKPNPGEVCALVGSWKATTTELAGAGFERSREKTIKTIGEWATSLQNTGESWDDTLVAIADPAAWAGVRYNEWLSVYTALSVTPPADFSEEARKAIGEITVAAAAKTSRFTAKDHDKTAEGAAKSAAQDQKLKVLKTATVFPRWTEETSGGSPSYRFRDVQVLAQKSGESFCRVYTLSVNQTWNVVTSKYNAPTSEITPAKSFLVSSCK
jgi:hypothetical protein